MKWLAVSLLLASLWGCSVRNGQTFTTEKAPVDTGLAYPVLKAAVDLRGEVPPYLVLKELIRKEALASYPAGDLPKEAMIFGGFESVGDVIAIVERATGWVYDPDGLRFYKPAATHSIDNPDGFGRVQKSEDGLERAGLAARSHVNVAVCFRRVNAGLGVSLDPAWDGNANAGAQLTSFAASIPEGVSATWNSTQERSYFEGVRDPEGGQLVETQRQTVESGLVISAICSRLPGGLFRIDGTLEISSFIGADLTRAKVSVPLQADGPRHVWLRTLIIRGGDAGFNAAFRHFGLDASASGEALELCVRVD